MQFFTITTLAIILLLSFCTIGKCCFFSFNKKASPPTTTPAPARSTRSRFYIEIVEGPNHTTMVSTIKKYPPIHSQTLEGFDTTDESLQGRGTGPRPVIQSQLAAPSPQESEAVVFGEGEDPRDADIRNDWQGSCGAKHWDVCNKLEEIRVMNVYNKSKDGKTEPVHLELPCLDLNITCLANGWTVNRCQLICMSKCNTEMLLKYDEFVKHYGPCNYMIT